MPNPLLSEALREAYASASVEFEVVNTIELTAETVTGFSPIRICDGNIPRTFALEDTSLVTFQPYPFKLTLPSLDSYGVKEMSINLSNVDGSVVSLLDTVRKLDEAILVKFRTYIAEYGEDGPQNTRPVTLEIVGIVATLTGVSIKASVSDIVNRQFPNDSYSYSDYPGLRG